MSILTVKNMSHSFVDRDIFKNVSFRLLKGEHVGLYRSKWWRIPDSGNIQWGSKVNIGYMDQHTNLIEGKSIRDILNEAFQDLFDIEIELNNIYNKMSFMDIEQMNKAIEKITDLQEILIMKSRKQ